MLLESITLCDFRCYYGENKIKFSINPKKNITVIHGENGVGKTALLNAIFWTFFGKLTSNFRNSKMLLNYGAKKLGRDKCSVEIEFKEDEREFVIKRTYTQSTKKSNLELWEVGDNNTLCPRHSDADYFINTIIPPQMAEYFFFQGEGSSVLEDKNRRDTFAKSTKDIFGFGVAEGLKKSLEVVNQEVIDKIAEQDTSGESTKLAESLKLKRSEFDNNQRAFDDATARKNALKEKLDSNHEDLSGINHTVLRGLREEEKNLEINIKNEKKIRGEIRLEKIGLIRKYGWAVFGADFVSESLDFIDESSLKGKLPEPYNRSFIEDILSKKTCICGACLKPNSEGWNKITAMRDKAADPVLQNRLLGIRAQITEIQTLNRGANEEINVTMCRYDQNKNKIGDLESRLRGIVEKIKKIPEERIRELQESKVNLENDRARQLRTIGSTETAMNTIGRDIKKINETLRSLTTDSTLVNALKAREEFVDAMKSHLQSYLADEERDAIADVVKKVNTILQESFRHDYKIELTDTSKITLLDAGNNIAGQGDGSNLLLNLIITAVLIKFAADRRDAQDSILSGATVVAPLVIDAPFGVLDASYRNVVVELLPAYTKQLVFFVSSSQWSDEMDSVVKGRLGKEFCLVMEESSPQNDRKLDEITIRGDKHVLSKYGQPVKRTSIFEVQL